MITVKYRLIGSTDNPTLSKSFENRTEANDWIAAQVNIMVLEIESSGAAVYSRIFG